jgi:hypothetical protein
MGNHNWTQGLISGPSARRTKDLLKLTLQHRKAFKSLLNSSAGGYLTNWIGECST